MMMMMMMIMMMMMEGERIVPIVPLGSLSLRTFGLPTSLRCSIVLSPDMPSTRQRHANAVVPFLQYRAVNKLPQD